MYSRIRASTILLLALTTAVFGQRRSELAPPVVDTTVIESSRTVEVEATYIGELFANARGGINTSKAIDYRGYLGLLGGIDFDAFSVGPGGRLVLLAELGHGSGLSAQHVGDFQLLSNIDADQFAQISELWWGRWFADMIRVQLGRQDGNAEFAMLRGAGWFVHSSLGLPPTIPLPTFPDPGIGLTMFIEPSESISVGFGVYEGSPNGGRLGLSRVLAGGAFLITQTTLFVGQTPPNSAPSGTADDDPSNATRRLPPGSYHVGCWYHSPDAAPIASTAAGDFDHNYGLYVGVQQRLWPFDVNGQRGLSVLCQCGWAPDDRNLIGLYFGAGLVVDGPFAGRPDDSMGLATAVAQFSRDRPDLTRETAIELYYRAKLTRYLAFEPDLQYIADPGGKGRNSIVTGLRFQLDY